ncbi:phosphatase PAP2 family protein [Tsukamurella sp. NPDC003166]|uniref:phosphatase PAP2 family protein n=1 Tax=Tsukamurella sp. NPDC003166 TaxID=3154444 RepID=UPI00339F4647
MNRNLRAWVLVYSVLIAVVLVAGLIVASGPTRVDSAVLNAIEPSRSAGVTSVVSVSTELFSPVLVPVWALCVAGFLLYRDRRVQRAAMVLAAVAGAAAVAEVIKLIVGRPRPPAADQLSAYEATLSYPSGHVTGTAALLLAIALVGTVGRPAARSAAVAAALVVTVFVAWTRLYLGVHWLTDVSAGLLVGAATAALVVALAPTLIAFVTERVAGRLPDRAAGWLAPAPSVEARRVGGAHRRTVGTHR